MIFAYGVDVPFADEWEIAPFFTKKAQGRLAFSELFALVNEYRQFFPNLIFVHLGWLTGWDVRFEMLLSFLLACLVSHNIYRLGRRTLRLEGDTHLWAFLLSSLIIFSLVQYENWLMGQQVIYFIPIACVTTCLLISQADMGIWKRLIICAALSTVSSFSSANGILCWVVTLPALTRAESLKAFARLRWPTAVWCLGFALCAALYLYDFQRPSSLPSTSESLSKPWLAVAYFLSLLGSPLTGFSRYLSPVAVLVGLALSVMFVRAWVSYLKCVPDADLRRRMLCWLMLGIYSAATAALITFGRAGFGLYQALNSRYTTFSLYLVVALIHLSAIVRGAVGRPRGERLPRAPRRLTAAIVILLGLHLLATVNSIRHVGEFRLRVLHSKACLLFINLVGGRCRAQVSPDFSLLQERARALDELGFLRPGLLSSRRVRDFAERVEPHPAYGSFERLIRESGTYVASGIAALPGRREPADAVLLTYRDGEGQDVLFAVAEMDYKGDFLKRLLNERALFSWQHSFTSEAIPAGAGELSAWAFDADSGRAFKLEGVHNLR
ncbi:MAG TPA: hypothetical protein VGB73_15690 [Pyrinomonadaceae bacterium]